MKRFLMGALLFAAPGAFAAGPNVLSNTDHIVNDVLSAISILGGSGITVNQTCGTGTTTARSNNVLCGASNSFINNTIVMTQGVDSGTDQFLPNTNTSTGAPNANVPYKVLNQSSGGYHLTFIDQGSAYSSLVANDQVYVMPYCGGPGAGDAYPPVAATNILPDSGTTGPLSGTLCGYATGIEFSMTVGYKGFATGSPSGTTEAFSGVLAVLRANHPMWTWPDIKGALRQTASNWATGYVGNSGVAGLGFGNIDYDAANAIASTTNIFLQGPGVTLTVYPGYARITLYPFRQTRRTAEVIYSVSSAYVWPVKNEYTASDIVASGATLLFTSNGTDVTPQYSFVPGATSTTTFVAFTTDGAGNYSRVEPYTKTSAAITVGGSCLQ